jgi:hypothetical protein
MTSKKGRRNSVLAIPSLLSIEAHCPQSPTGREETAANENRLFAHRGNKLSGGLGFCS